MKTLAFVLVSLFFFSSCSNQTEFAIQVYSKSSAKNCKSDYNCSNINLTVLQATNKNSISDSINNSIFNAVRNGVYAGENPKEVKNYADLTNSFVSVFNSVKNELKQNEIPSWEASAEVKVGFQSKRILNIVVTHYLFTGGAHGYGAVESLLFNPKTGKIIRQNQIFSDIAKITSLAESKFRIQQKMEPNTSLTDAGYFFENNIFVLPKNILLTKKGITLHYNQYEVASYASGPIELELSYDEIKDCFLLK